MAYWLHLIMIGILWQLYFVPEHTDQHELIVFDKHNSEVKSGCVLKFYLNPFSTSVLYKVRFFRVLYFFNNALTQKDIEVRFALKHKEDFCGCNYVRIVTIMRSLRYKI
jgi:hypothetical protein